MIIIFDIVHHLEFLKHNILDTGPVSVVRCNGEKIPTQMEQSERISFDLWMQFLIC
jgi:hypothetical protein